MTAILGRVKLRTPFLVGLAVTVAACGNRVGPSATGIPASPSTLPSASQTAPASPGATPAADQDAIRKAAAVRYLAAANKAKADLAALNKKYPGTTFKSLTLAHRYYKASAAIVGALIDALKKMTAPSDTAADLHALIARNAELQAIEIELSTTTAAEYQGAFEIYVDRGRAATAAANLIRVDLGLPPVN